MRKTYGIPLVLVLALLLGLLLTAGPALANSPNLGNPPGFQWGGPHFNGTLEFTSDTTAEIYAADPRGSGEMVFRFLDYSEEVIGNTLYLHYLVAGTVTNDGGVWTFTDAVTLASGPVKGHGSGMNMICLAYTATGGLNPDTGRSYAGLSYVAAWHSGTGMVAPFVYKGSIY